MCPIGNNCFWPYAPLFDYATMRLKRPTLSRSSKTSQTETDEQIQEAVTDAIRTSNDKVVEIRPANESKSGGRRLLMMLTAGALAVGYWLRRSENPARALRKAASQTAGRTEQASTKAAETIQKEGGTLAARVEEKSQKAGERVQEGGETMADRVEEKSQKAGEQVEETGENAAEKTERAGKKAAEKAEESGSGSSDGSSSS